MYKNDYLKELKNKEISINGWVKKIRKLGKLVFFNLQGEEINDIQIIVKDKIIIEEIENSLNSGDLIKVTGEVRSKINTSENQKEEFEILLKSWNLINKTIQLPFEIRDDLDLKEDNRYRYRYLDLRREKSKKILIEKHNFLHYIRNFFYNEEFVEIETPILSQFSPEGAKTFLVPSNLKNRFYTLAQSPQIFKQILMISSFKKYYQIAKTFRNEDARSNRQLEFLQLDVEMSFPNQEYYFELIEKMLIGFLTNHLKVERKKITFDFLTFEECMNNYGSDKPDLRNPIKIIDFGFNSSSIINNQPRNYNYVEKGIFIEKDIENKIEEIKKIFIEENIKNFFIIKKNRGSIEELYSKSTESYIKSSLEGFKEGYFIISRDLNNKVLNSLSKIINLFNDLFIEKENSENLNKEYKFLWITDWPLFEYSEEKNKIVSLRHPFTLPKEEYISKIMSEKPFDFLSIKSEAYDLVCNGEEIASGSLRIYQRQLQEKIFEILGFSKEEMEKHFGYFLKALEFAAPPHGGIGMGIERMLAIFLNLKSLKETIAFPKNIDGTCSLTGAPNLL